MTDFAVQVSFSNRSFSITGDERFVKERYDELMAFFKASPDSYFGQQEGAGDDDEPNSCDESSFAGMASNNKYIEHGIYYIDSETGMPVIQTAVPGDSMREKMRNVALILLYAVGNVAMNASYIKEQCVRQSCLDANNFSKAFEKDRRNFIRKRKAGSREWTVELSIPGLETAKALLENICSEA